MQPPGQKVVVHDADHEPCYHCKIDKHNRCDEQCGHDGDDGTELCHGPCACQCRRPLTPEEIMKLRALIGVLER